MDAATLAQYRYVIALLLGGVAALAVFLVVWRAPAPAEPEVVHGDPATWLLWCLAGLAVGAAIVLLLPATITLRFFQSRRVAAAVIVFVLLAAAPVLAAWRQRS